MPTDQNPSYASAFEADLATQWQPLPSSRLWEILTFGLNEQIDKIDVAITNKWQEELAQLIKDWFGVSKSELDPKILKKLTNTTLAAGKQGFDRVCETLSEWPLFDLFDQRKSKMELLISRTKRKNYLITNDFPKLNRCHLCDKSLKIDEYIVFRDSLNGIEKKQHFVCFVAESLRQNASEHRNSKHSFYKLAKSARSILTAQRGQDKFRSDKTLESFADYISWLQALDKDWQATTKVKEAFHKSYIKNFHDYANFVLDAYLNPTKESAFLRNKLDKHFDTKRFESVIDNYLSALPNSFGALKRDYRDPASNRVIDYQVGAVPIEAKQVRNIGQFTGISDLVRRNISVMLDLSKYPSSHKQSLVYFLLGLIQGTGMRMQRISDTTYFIAKPEIQMFGEEFKSVDPNVNESQLNNFLKI